MSDELDDVPGLAAGKYLAQRAIKTVESAVYLQMFWKRFQKWMLEREQADEIQRMRVEAGLTQPPPPQVPAGELPQHSESTIIGRGLPSGDLWDNDVDRQYNVVISPKGTVVADQESGDHGMVFGDLTLDGELPVAWHRANDGADPSNLETFNVTNEPVANLVVVDRVGLPPVMPERNDPVWTELDQLHPSANSVHGHEYAQWWNERSIAVQDRTEADLGDSVADGLETAEDLSGRPDGYRPGPDEQPERSEADLDASRADGSQARVRPNPAGLAGGPDAGAMAKQVGNARNANQAAGGQSRPLRHDQSRTRDQHKRESLSGADRFRPASNRVVFRRRRSKFL